MLIVIGLYHKGVLVAYSQQFAEKASPKAKIFQTLCITHVCIAQAPRVKLVIPSQTTQKQMTLSDLHETWSEVVPYDLLAQAKLLL